MVDATLHTLPLTLTTAKHRVSTTSPPTPFPTSLTDNYGDGTRETRRKDNSTPPPTFLTDNPGDARHQSDHFRLQGPNLLDAPLVPEQQAQIPASTHPPPSTVRLPSRRRTVIQSPGRWSARPRAANDLRATTDVSEPTMATPGVNLDP